MENAELIDSLRYCLSDDYVKRGCCKCPINKDGMVCGTQDDAIKYAADALEAINKTVIPHRNYERCHIYWCDCGWFLRNKDQTPNYCPNCGKRIEWENAE